MFAPVEYTLQNSRNPDACLQMNIPFLPVKKKLNN